MSCQNQNRPFKCCKKSLRLNFENDLFCQNTRRNTARKYDFHMISKNDSRVSNEKLCYHPTSPRISNLLSKKYERSSVSRNTTSNFKIAICMVILFGLAPLSSSNPEEDSGSSTRYESWRFEMKLDEEGAFLVQWTPLEDHCVFRVIAKTRGYIGLGLSPKPYMDGADIVVGWVHSGKAYLQDRHAVGNYEPVVDRNQNWMLVAGFENDTHTVLIMSRKYNTCDKQDHVISNDTVRLLWAFHPDDPVNPEHVQPRLHYHGWRRGVQTLYLMAGPTKHSTTTLTTESLHGSAEAPIIVSDEPSQAHLWIVKNKPMKITNSSDSLLLCNIHKPPTIFSKQHIIKYEPIIGNNNRESIWRIMFYECSTKVKSSRLENLIERGTEDCNHASRKNLNKLCRSVVVVWTRGSNAVTFPDNVGYPLYAEPQRYYMLEIHYNIPEGRHTFWDSSGLRILFTPNLREHDGGILNLGLTPEWKNIIPPSQSNVLKEGHCVKECTRTALPKTGIKVFGIVHHTHFLGRGVRIRHISNDSELEPLVEDNNYDPVFQNYRTIHHPRTVMPGDHLITECNSNSMNRSIITVGGLTSRDAACTSFLFYWPRVNLSICQSMPSLSTVLYSLGIEALTHSGPVRISRPSDLAGKTLKWRLLNYDWIRNFNYFQTATHEGTFNPSCNLAPKLERVDYKYPKIHQIWSSKNVCEIQENTGIHKLKNQEDISNKDYESFAFQDSAAIKPLAIIDVDSYRKAHVFPYAFESTKWDQSHKLKDSVIEKELREVELDLEAEVHQKYPDGFKEQATKKDIPSESWSLNSRQSFQYTFINKIEILSIMYLLFYGYF